MIRVHEPGDRRRAGRVRRPGDRRAKHIRAAAYRTRRIRRSRCRHRAGAGVGVLSYVTGKALLD